MRRSAQTLLVVLSLCLGVGQARAAVGTYTVTTSGSPKLGKVVNGSTTTSFHVDATSGAVSLTGGNGYVVAGSSSGAAPAFSLTCSTGGTNGVCSGHNHQAQVTVSCAGGGSPATTVTKINTSGFGGTQSFTTTSKTFSVDGPGPNSPQTLNVGFDIQFPANASPTGLDSSAYNCTVTVVGQ